MAALAVPFVVDQHGEFGLAQFMLLAQAAHAENLLFLALGDLELGDERDFTVVIVEADARQALVRHALAQQERVQVAQVHAPVGKRLVELDHQGLILGQDGPQDQVPALQQAIASITTTNGRMRMGL